MSEPRIAATDAEEPTASPAVAAPAQSDRDISSVSHANREEWLAARRHGIGGSEAPIVLGVSPWSSRYRLWAEKTGRISHDDQKTTAQRWGQRLEPLIADEYATMTGRTLVDLGPFTITRARSKPFMFCTHDRLVAAADQTGYGPLSIKTADPVKAALWRDEAPIDYQIQLQHEMAVSGCGWGSFAVLIGLREFRWLDVLRHEDFIEFLEEQLFAFWKLIEHDQPPEMDDSKFTAEALRRMYPHDVGTTVLLPPEAVEWDRQLVDCKAQIKALEQRRMGLENRMAGALGDARYGQIPGVDGVLWSYQTIRRKAYSVAPVEYRQLRRVTDREDS